MNEVVHTSPTIGSNVEEVVWKNIHFLMWDIGGQESLRASWNTYYTNTQVCSTGKHCFTRIHYYLPEDTSKPLSELYFIIKAHRMAVKSLHIKLMQSKQEQICSVHVFAAEKYLYMPQISCYSIVSVAVLDMLEGSSSNYNTRNSLLSCYNGMMMAVTELPLRKFNTNRMGLSVNVMGLV